MIDRRPPWSETLHGELVPLIDYLDSRLIGKHTVMTYLVTALLAGGHILLDDVPGVGKTTLAKALADALDLRYHRIQCTPDLLPSDITGMTIFNPATRQFEFHPGPLFSHLIIADEINRTSPRTQSALLEVMQERQVTVDGVSRPVPNPFMLIATENPLEFEGTYPLPESQLDRFLFRLSLGYPTPEEELALLTDREEASALPTPVLTTDRLLALQEAVRQVVVAPAVKRYLVDIVQATRIHPAVRLGLSPRATLALYHASQAWAFLHDRPFVTPDDIQDLAPYVALHRMVVDDKAWGSPTSSSRQEIFQEILRRIPVPTVPEGRSL
ncbi:MAG: MoxR family ATPase [Sulfobacillus sp.]|nr:MoxR family ATPase [Sulfobacillus sp.]